MARCREQVGMNGVHIERDVADPRERAQMARDVLRALGAPKATGPAPGGEAAKKSDARALYDDVSPKPTPEQIEMTRMERVYRAAAQAAGTPDRRQRRELRRFKQSGSG